MPHKDAAWDRHRITDKVLSVAERLCRVDGQQLSQLAGILEKADPEEVFQGLYNVFRTGSDDYWQRLIEQEYAGHLLIHCRPPCPLPVDETVIGGLDRWNLSAWQWPLYLAYSFDPDELEHTLSDLEKHSPGRALKSLRWWVGAMWRQDTDSRKEFRRFAEEHRWVDTSIR